MRISDSEVKRILSHSHEGMPTHAIVSEIIDIGHTADIKQDRPLIDSVVELVKEMPDRESVILELKARIEAGTYNPSGDDIADTMIRRAIADRLS